MADPLLIAKNADLELNLLPSMANRHGLITGATGTGKTVTLQRIAEQFSGIGVPTFMSDVKGDLAGISEPGGDHAKVTERLQLLGISDHQYQGFPVTLWDCFGERGHPARATVSDMGPLLLSRMLSLNETQTGVLNIAFKLADDEGLLLLDLKDLRSLVQFTGENAKAITTKYGNVSAASIGAIQRALLSLESQGADSFFGEPMLNYDDLMQTSENKGVINILAADRLLSSPKVYAMFLLWLLSELFENLPEVGDQEKPKLVFFFDEAHVLFDSAPEMLVDKIEQVVRLIRSKGVGVFFITQNPADIPDKILSQLGNRVQHALRAYSPRDQKAVRAAAETMRDNPDLDEETAITELGVGEALVQFLEKSGKPAIVQRAYVVPPCGHIGPIEDRKREILMRQSLVAGVYDQTVDRESAYEHLKVRAEQATKAEEETRAAKKTVTEDGGILEELLRGPRGSSGRRREGVVEAMAKSAARSLGNQIGHSILRGILGSLRGGR